MATSAASMPPTINSLSLLALKCGSNVFDLSSDMSNISIRDQVVRGRLLARDLACLPRRPSKVLVVGAGFAGISAALACADAGMGVVVVERNDEPFKLQAKPNDRWVGPLMYEWPMHGSHDQTYPPATTPALTDSSILGEVWATLSPGSQPLPAQALAGHAQTALRSLIGAKPISVVTNINDVDVTNFVKAFHQGGSPYLDLSGASSWPSSGVLPSTPLSSPDVIILSGGVGDERITLDPPPGVGVAPPALSNAPPAAGKPFWDVDGWIGPAGASANDSVGVFGAGDGALQDVLRALTGLEHPLMALERIRKHSRGVAADLEAVEAELLAAELEGRLAATWTQVWEVAPSPRGPVKNHRGHIDQWVDNRCAEIARKLAWNSSIVGAVGGILRNGTGQVHHVFREDHFTKTYLLNRFLVHLIDACQKVTAVTYPSKVRYLKWASVPHIHGIEVPPTMAGKKFRVWLRGAPPAVSTAHTLHLDRIAVRFGPDPSKLPGRQMVGLTNKDIAERTAIGQVPCPIVAHPMNW